MLFSLRHLKTQIKLVNIRPDDIVDGNPKLTLGLVWTIILHYQVFVWHAFYLSIFPLYFPHMMPFVTPSLWCIIHRWQYCFLVKRVLLFPKWFPLAWQKQRCHEVQFSKGREGATQGFHSIWCLFCLRGRMRERKRKECIPYQTSSLKG